MFRKNIDGNEQNEKKSGKTAALIAVILMLLALAAGVAVFALKYFSAGARTERLLTQGEQYISEKEYDLAEAAFREALEIRGSCTAMPPMKHQSCFRFPLWWRRSS